MKTIPVYWGCSNIGDFFNLNGIVIFNTQEELISILNEIKSDKYKIDFKVLKENYELALKYRYDNDKIYNKYIKDLIKN